MRLKGKLYKSVVRHNMLYCSVCWVVDKRIKQRMSVTVMRILRWMSGMIR